VSARVVVEEGGISLVAGLNWAPLVQLSGRKLASEIRKAAREVDASRILLFKCNELRSLGLYAQDLGTSDDDLDQEQGRGLFSRSTLHSFAATFAAFVGAANALLAYTLGKTGTHAVLVIIEGGVPVIDEIKDIEAVQAIANAYASGQQGFNYALHTNDPGTFGGVALPDGHPILTEADLLGHVGRHTRLVGKPINLLAVAGLFLVLGLAVAAYFAWTDYQAQQSRLKALRQASEADPVPKYEAALIAAAANLGPPKAEIARLLDIIGQYPVSEAGWILSGVSCSGSAGSCVSSWVRESGTTQDLTAARTQLQERLEVEEALSRVRLTRALDIKAAGLAPAAIPGGAEQAVTMDSLLQRWNNAGLEITYSKSNAMPWPAVSGLDLKGLRPGTVVQRTPLQVIAPLYLAEELASQTPANVWWTDLEASVDMSKGDVLVKFRGHVYAR
jgi:hypothetical protein